LEEFGISICPNSWNLTRRGLRHDHKKKRPGEGAQSIERGAVSDGRRLPGQFEGVQPDQWKGGFDDA